MGEYTGLVASLAFFVAWSCLMAAPYFLARRRKKQELKQKRQWAEARQRQRSRYVYEGPEAEADELERFARFHDIFDDRD